MAATARAKRRGRQSARPEAPAGAPPTATARQRAGAAIACSSNDRHKQAATAPRVELAGAPP
eukprot:13701517-Alexandrium_andersonii.AAC.1